MAFYEVKFASGATKDLRGLPKATVKLILKRIQALANNPRPSGAVKLAGQETYRVRQGDYRILYQIFDRMLVVDVIQIGHRSDVYRH
jgi:mRNA interferase RelE/StbE